MSRRNDSEFDGEPTINQNWKVPLSILVSAVILTVGICGSFYSLKYGFETQLSDLNRELKTGLDKNLSAVGRSMTTEQFQHWLEDAREQNRTQNPNLQWPRLPAKDAAWGWIIPKDVLASRSTFTVQDLNL